MSEFSVFSNKVLRLLNHDGVRPDGLDPKVSVVAIAGIPAGQSVTIRKLNRKRLDKASTVLQLAALDQVNVIGGAAKVKELTSLATPPPAPVEGEKPVAPPPPPPAKSYVGYDRTTLLDLAITEWTLDELKTVDAIDELDDDLADAVADAIMDLVKPRRTEDEEKNGSAPSTSL